MGYKDAAKILLKIVQNYPLTEVESDGVLVAIGLLMTTKDETEAFFGQLMNAFANSAAPEDADNVE